MINTVIQLSLEQYFNYNPDVVQFYHYYPARMRKG